MDLTNIINLYRGPLIGLIASWGVPWADAAEIAQDSFAEAYLRRESCRGDWQEPEVFGRWLRGVARNRQRNWRRSQRRRLARVATVEPAVLDAIATPSRTESTEQLDALRQAIDRLPLRQRQVIVMHYLEETSVKAVASLLSVAPKTVEGRLYKARRRLRQLLDRSASRSQIAKVLLCL